MAGLLANCYTLLYFYFTLHHSVSESLVTDLEELPFVGRRPQPADVLEREPADTDRLDGGKVRIVGGMSGFLVVAVDRRQSVDCQTYRRDDDERDRNDRNHLRHNSVHCDMSYM